MLLSIDPGSTESAYVVCDEKLKLIEFGKIKNSELLKLMVINHFKNCDESAIEMIACYGMAVGREVFATCVWIGRFDQALKATGINVNFIYRKDEKINLCGSMKAKDNNIRKALIDRFARHDFKNGKGTIKNKDFFYGFKSDIWASFAVAVTYCDMKLEGKIK